MRHERAEIMDVTRRGFLGYGAMGAAAAVLLTACDNSLAGNGVGSDGAARVDARVDATRDYLFSNYPGTQDLARNAKGILFMPLVTEIGLGVGGGYGRGALRINDITVDFYAATRATIGIQIGAQQYAHALFFMTEDALANFRQGSGWAAGADIRYATPEQGGTIGKETTELDPVIALVFGQQGLIAGATLSGVKYSRIIP
jgi:lipid-binding SYLF domain-containing protein